MQQSDHFHQMELPSSIARTAKDKATPFTMIDNRVVHLDYKALGLQRGDKEIHIAMLSLPDNWDFKHIALWIAKKFKFSPRTAYRIVGRLLDVGLMARTEDKLTGRWGYQIYEIPCENRPTGKAARERVVVDARKACHGRFIAAPRMPRKHHGYLTVENPDPAFLCTGRGVTKLSHRQTTKGNVLRSSEHSSTPLAPKGALDSLNDLRVSCSERKTDTMARSAKRPKGRKSPGKPHNARSKQAKARVKRLSREAINLGHHVATPDTHEFMRNLATRLPEALRDLQTLPEARTQEYLDRLMANPLMAVAQEVYGHDKWTCERIRSFLGALDERLPVSDLLLCWTGINSGWSSSLTDQVRSRLSSGLNPTSPNLYRDKVSPDVIHKEFVWQDWLDGRREAMSEQCTRAVVELLEGVNLEEPTSIQEHPFIWTALLANRKMAREFVDDDMMERAEQSLIPATRDELLEWVESRGGDIPMRWNGRFCKGGLETVVGLGISYALGEKVPRHLYTDSGFHGCGYHTTEKARYAEVPVYDLT